MKILFEHTKYVRLPTIMISSSIKSDTLKRNALKRVKWRKYGLKREEKMEYEMLIQESNKRNLIKCNPKRKFQRRNAIVGNMAFSSQILVKGYDSSASDDSMNDKAQLTDSMNLTKN